MRPQHLTFTVLDCKEFGFNKENDKNELYVKTFWKPHYFIGVPKGYYDPKWVHIQDLIPKNTDDGQENQPNCKELISELFKKADEQT